MEELPFISGNIVDPLNRRIYSGTIKMKNGIIYAIEEDNKTYDQWIMPGFIDSHIHIESSMLVPYEFARMALPHGTVATISDPHEIANVLGVRGVFYMLDNARDAKLKFHFGAPSCVPATSFETAGAVLNVTDVELLLKREDIYYLSEMMNYPGVLHGDPIVLSKIEAARKAGKPVDGHAPGLGGADARRYIEAGISTDHESYSLDEALHKLKYGMKILIREGSAARNFEALHSLISTHTDMVMLCSDDKHPDELQSGHINQLVLRALKSGHDLMDILRVASVNPVKHYGMNVGLLQLGDQADFIVTKDLESLQILRTVINGITVAERGISVLEPKVHPCPNAFDTPLHEAHEFRVRHEGSKLRVIEVLDGQLITHSGEMEAVSTEGWVPADPRRDLLKISVVNRYHPSTPATGFIHGIGIKRGAIASSVAHDSHNIVVVGADDASIARAVNALVKARGGLSLVDEDEEMVLPLPVAGLMSDLDGVSVGHAYSKLDSAAKALGSPLRAPFMTLSFMALLVIPSLKLSDKGLFDGNAFRFVPLFMPEP